MTDTQPEANAQGEEANVPQFRILTQYIKDVSFENPNAPASLQGGETPKIDVQLGVNANQVQDGLFEVSLPIRIDAKRADQTMFLLELDYCGLFALENIPAESMDPALYIECPRLLFPFVRRIVSDLTQDGGFPALPIEPVDFVGLYQARLQQLAEEQQGKEGNGAAAPEATGEA